MCFRSFFLNFLVLPFLSAAAPPAAFAMVRSQFLCGYFFAATWSPSSCRPPFPPTPASHLRARRGPRSPQNESYFVAFFLPAAVPLRGPLRVRALVCVRCPRTGRLRR